jgi:uncharacterized protein (DUF1778 family)
MAVAEAPAKNAATRKTRPAAKQAGKARAPLNMRIQPELRILIDRAAEVAGKNRTDFVLDAARQAAQTTLLDQVHFQLNPAAFKAFVQRLDAPPQPNQRLRKSLQTLAPWE